VEMEVEKVGMKKVTEVRIPNTKLLKKEDRAKELEKISQQM